MHNRVLRLLIFVLLLTVVILLNQSTVWAQSSIERNVPATPDDVIFETEIAYREGHPRWVLNVIQPNQKSTDPRPAVLLVHGGGWAMGDQYKFTRMGFMIARQGYVVILPTYRLYRDAPFPACLEDLKNAIRWVRANAKKYNIDPNRIGAYGNSAGGTQVLTAALTNGMKSLEGDGPYQEFSSDLQAVVCSGAVGDMLHPTHGKRAVFAYRNMATGGDRSVSDTEVKKVLRQASPSTYIRKDAPPLLVIHGAKDDVVVVDSTDEFVQAMKKVEADITYMRYEAGTHIVMGQYQKETTPAMLKFFKKNL